MRKQSDDTHSITSTSCETAFDDKSERPLHIDREEGLIQLLKQVKNGSLDHTRVIRFSFQPVDPCMKVTRMKCRLDKVFVALGGLPHLEEVTFVDAVLILPSVNKLLRQTQSLTSIQFHRCKFILAANKNKTEDAVDNLWTAIQRQQNLAVLEIMDCRSVAVEEESPSDSEDPKFSFQVPAFLQEPPQKLVNLHRLVLDECIFDLAEQTAFVKLLSNNACLEELEIRPSFDLTDTPNRQQYQAKKRAFRQFMTKTVPTTLSNINNSPLKKLVISLNDYHMEHVFVDTMIQWVQVVQHHNFFIQELRATHQPLGESYNDELYQGSVLYQQLLGFLRLNQMLGPTRTGTKEIGQSVAPPSQSNTVVAPRVVTDVYV